MIRIATGISLLKHMSIVEACDRLKIDAAISSWKVSSGQNEQPVGYEETFKGALTRAYRTHKFDPGCDISIGIENGIFRFGSLETKSITLDMAIVVIIKRDGERIVTNSVGIQFYEEYVRTAEERGFKTTTVGSVIAERLGGDPADPHSTLTDGKVTRKALLTEALVAALSQL
jgi:non-canonical (house-cleaning) NTP pyrophosphatase